MTRDCAQNTHVLGVTLLVAFDTLPDINKMNYSTESCHYTLKPKSVHVCP